MLIKLEYNMHQSLACIPVFFYERAISMLIISKR